MLNLLDFSTRLQTIMNFYSETASSFSEKIGVQRSSISHILSGRNKPSLDFIMKVLHSYPDVEFYWLLNGKGNFPTSAKGTSSYPNSQLELNIQTPNNTNKVEQSEIEKIVFFYKDGTFKSYKP